MVLAKFCCQAMCNFCSGRKILKEKKNYHPASLYALEKIYDCIRKENPQISVFNGDFNTILVARH